jgi:hypothetical protein
MVARRIRGVGQGVVRRSAGRTTKEKKSLTCDANTGRYTWPVWWWKWNAPPSHPKATSDTGAGGVDKDGRTNEGRLLAWGARRKNVKAADPTRRRVEGGPDGASPRCRTAFQLPSDLDSFSGKRYHWCRPRLGRGPSMLSCRQAQPSLPREGVQCERSCRPSYLPHSGKVHVLCQRYWEGEMAASPEASEARELTPAAVSGCQGQARLG